MAELNKILLLGGYGKAGGQIAQVLIDHSDYSITLAGRNKHKAVKMANAINKCIPTERCNGMEVDIKNIPVLKKTLPEYDLLINCVPLPSKGDPIIRAIVNANIHYIDLIPSSLKQIQFENYKSIIIHNNKTCILEAGWEPGLPAFVARLGAQKLNGSAKDIELHAVYREDDMATTSVADIVEHTQLTAAFFKNGRWVRNSIFNTQKMHFPAPFGTVKGYPTELAELKTIVPELDLKSLRIYQGGYNLVCDLILFVWTAFGLSKNDYLLTVCTKLFRWANKQFTAPPFGGMIKAKISGDTNSLEVIVTTENLYQATAIPVVVAVKQILDQEIDNPGVHFMGSIVEPTKFQKEISKMGITVKFNDMMT